MYFLALVAKPHRKSYTFVLRIHDVNTANNSAYID